MHLQLQAPYWLHSWLVISNAENMAASSAQDVFKKKNINWTPMRHWSLKETDTHSSLCRNEPCILGDVKHNSCNELQQVRSSNREWFPLCGNMTVVWNLYLKAVFPSENLPQKGNNTTVIFTFLAIASRRPSAYSVWNRHTMCRCFLYCSLFQYG